MNVSANLKQLQVLCRWQRPEAYHKSWIVWSPRLNLYTFRLFLAHLSSFSAEAQGSEESNAEAPLISRRRSGPEALWRWCRRSRSRSENWRLLHHCSPDTIQHCNGSMVDGLLSVSICHHIPISVTGMLKFSSYFTFRDGKKTDNRQKQTNWRFNRTIRLCVKQSCSSFFLYESTIVRQTK